MATLPIRNVVLYDPAGQVALKAAAGTLSENLTSDAFATGLQLANPLPGTVGPPVQNGAYYAIGERTDGSPFRTESVTCTNVDELLFSGVIVKPAGQARMARAADSPADILITYINWLPTDLSLITSWSNLQAGFGGLTQSPGPTLFHGGNEESIGANQLLSSVDEGPADISMTYGTTGPNSVHVSVWIHFNFQFAGGGFRPIWYVSWQDPTGYCPGWLPSGDDPSTQYAWPKNLGFTAIGKPVSGHSSLTVSVTINP